MTSLAVGSSVVLYDGSPFKPTPNALWDLIDEVGITILGTGAKWLSALEDREIQPGLCRVFFPPCVLFVQSSCSTCIEFSVIRVCLDGPHSHAGCHVHMDW